MFSESDFIGVDIGSSAVKMVSLKKSGEGFSLQNYISVPVPDGLTESDSKIDRQKLATIIRKALDDANISEKRVVSAISGTSVFVSTITLPLMAEHELAKAVSFQVEQNLPVKITDVKYDWQIVKKDEAGGKVHIVVFAATNNKVNGLLEVFQQAELEPIAIEAAPVAIARSLAQPEVPGAVIMDIGLNRTEIAIIENGTLMQTRGFPIGGMAMTRGVMQHLRLDKDQSETFKIKFGLSQDKLEGQVFRAMEPVIRSIASEAMRSVSFYNETYGGQVSRIVLAGGASRLALLPEYLKSVTGLEVVYGNPWSKVSYPANINEEINASALEFAVAVGLAMR